jgi:tricorn protease
MSRKAVLVLCALLVSAPAQAQSKLLRHPTYSKGKVAFSYLGDIWIANEDGSGVMRLTDNAARDVYPRFSPDGNWIAFSSNRQGNDDVHVIPATGGKPRQITFHSAPDTVSGWSPDGKKILFSSTRAKGAFPSVATLFEVPVEGGIEQPLAVDWGAWGSYSPDGKRLVFQRHPSVWSRKHYRGAYAADLWVMDLTAKTYSAARLGDPNYRGNSLWPMYGADGYIYFVADITPNEKTIKNNSPEARASVNNIWKVSEKGGMPIQVTKHTDGNLFFPSISADRKTIVYEDNFGLWKLDVASGKYSEIRIDIKSDSKNNDTELVTLSNNAEAFHLSPSNQRAAIVVHGEVFTIATNRGEPQRVTETAWREQDVRWSPNGKWLAFVSDRTGRQEVWISDELGKSPKKLSDADCDKNAIVWSPDSKSLMWSGSDHKLRLVDVDSAKTDVLVDNPGGNIGTPQFSPDGKWISYSKQDNLLRNHVFIRNLASGDEHMIKSDDFQVATGAKWTLDGKKLLLIGGVNLPNMASQGFRGTPSQLYSISLTHMDKAPDDREVNTEEQALAALNENAGGGGRAGRGAGGGAPANVTVAIEWDGLERRIKKLTSMTASVTTVVPAPDSRIYAFMAAGGAPGAPPEGEAAAGGGPAIYTIAEDGTQMQRLNTTVASDGGAGRGRGGRGGGGGGFGGGNEPQWTRDSRSIYFMAGGGIYSVAVPTAGANSDAPGTSGASAGGRGRGGRGGATATTAAAATTSPAAATPRQVTFTVRMVLDRVAERQQVFEEAWRVMKNRFYDASMHGANWAAAKDTYESLLPHIADTDELHNVIMEMIGEMNASHTGISGGGGLPGEPAPQERIQTRNPGFELAPDASGYYKVAAITRKGPADFEYVKLAPGNFILAVNEKPLKSTDNYWELFNVLPGSKLEFLVNNKPSVDGAWTVSLEPLSTTALATLEYDNWVASRKQMVEKLTNSEIGYLHIKAMDAPSLLKFQEDLIDNRGKKALIIDQRFNGGGGIDQELLEILNQRKQYQRTRGRDSLDVPRPVEAFFGPMVVLQNERSASDAEMFPAGFKALGLGKVIGVNTMGAVIGTGSFTLLDGSALRTPGAGVYTADGQNMENYGVPPDIYQDNTPADFAAGHDRQIEKAIEVLRSEMK